MKQENIEKLFAAILGYALGGTLIVCFAIMSVHITQKAVTFLSICETSK